MLNKKKYIPEKLDISIVLILIIGLIGRGAIAYWIAPGYDESYYYIYTHQLDWSYFDHPLLVALSTGLGTWLTGVANQFTIRWGALLLYTGSLWLLYLTAKRLFNPQTAKLTLLVASLNPAFAVIFGIFTLPDAPLIFFWSASFYCAVSEFFRADNPYPQPYRPTYRLAILGILVGLTCLGKYHGFFVGLGFVIFALTIPRYHAVFRSGWLWLGLGLFVLTLFPLWYWNIQHDWISFQFHLSKRFDKPKSFNVLGVLGVLLGIMMMMFPTLGFPMGWVTLKTFWQQIPTFFSIQAHLKRSDFANRQWLILSVSVPMIIGFSLVGGYYFVTPSWVAPGFWTPTLLLGYWMGQRSKRWAYRWLKYSGIAIASLLLLVLLHLNLGIFQKPSQYGLLGGMIAPKADPSTEVFDLNQLQQAFVDSPLFSSALANSQFIFTQSYFLGGLIDLAVHSVKPIPVTCFCRDSRGFGIWYDPKEWIGKDGLFITGQRFVSKPEIIDRYRPYFQSFRKIGEIPIKRGGVVTNIFYVYQGQNFLKVYP